MSGRRFSLDAGTAARYSRVLIALSLCLCVLPRARAQESPKAQEKEEVVTVKSTLVNIDVTVKDKSGKYVTDLGSDDFTVYENGVRQKVEFFDPPSIVGVVDTAQHGGASASNARVQLAQPRNIISIVLDGQTTEQQNLRYLREGTLKYIRERIADTDAVALFKVAAGLQLLQPFTRDKSRLTAAVENAFNSAAASKTSEYAEAASEVQKLQTELSGLQGTEGRDARADPSGAQGAGSATLAAQRALEQFTVLRSQLSLQQSRPVLASLAALCEAQRDLPGKKTVVLFSQGFITSDTQDWQVQSIIDLANRANVAIYIIDAAGLRGGAPETGSYIPTTPLANVGALKSIDDRMKASGGEDVFDNVRHEGRDRQFDILYRISGDTGGKFIKGTNDIARGLERVDEEFRARYTIGYHSTDANFNGDFRKLKVEVRRPDVQVATRSGFYAIAHDNAVFFSPEDRKLLAGFSAAQAHPSIPLFVQLSPFKTADGGYRIPLSIEIEPGAVKFEQKGDKKQLQLEVLGRIRVAGEERAAARIGGFFQIALDERQYQAMLTDKLFLRQDLDLAPGEYDFELIIRDRLSGKLAAKGERLSLPESSEEFSSSAVVLSRHAEAAGQQAEGSAADVLSHAGAAIRPSPSREFKVGDNLIIFFRLYNAGVAATTGKPSVKVSVRLLTEGRDAVKPLLYELTETTSAPVPHLMFSKYVSLAPLHPGKYTLVVESKDTTTGKLVRRQEPFVITQ